MEAKLKLKRRVRKKEALGGPFQSGVVYVGHLPHGFYEEQLEGYFSQFGRVTKVKVARNKKVRSNSRVGRSYCAPFYTILEWTMQRVCFC